MDNYTKTLIKRMAHVTDLVLSDTHYAVLEYAYQYYKMNKVGPLYHNIKRNTGLSKRDIEGLFPHSLHSVYSWVGIPIHSTSALCKPVPTIRVDDYREVYLDHGATTYLRDEVVAFLGDYYGGALGFGNPSNSTYPGKQAYDLIHVARSQIADCMQVRPDEVVFTSGGSEANNMAIKGIAFNHLDGKGHIITSRVEHHSVLRTIHYLEQLCFDVTYLEVDQDGRISPQSVQDHISKETILVSIMAANNEIGTINPIGRIGDICRAAGVPFMVDAAQAWGRFKLHPKELGISLLSCSGHKVYSPKGVGALYIEKGCELTPLIHGGEQEFGSRAGTENVGSIAAFGKASKLIHAEMAEENRRLLGLRAFFLRELERVEADFIVNGPLDDRLPQNLSIGFLNVDSGALLLSLNQIGVYVSSGSACSAGDTEESHVLKAIGADTERYGTIRFSFGLRTTKEDLAYLFKYLPAILEKLRVANSRP